MPFHVVAFTKYTINAIIKAVSNISNPSNLRHLNNWRVSFIVKLNCSLSVLAK